jgi:hypothetical protein
VRPSPVILRTSAVVIVLAAAGLNLHSLRITIVGSTDGPDPFGEVVTFQALAPTLGPESSLLFLSDSDERRSSKGRYFRARYGLAPRTLHRVTRRDLLAGRVDFSGGRTVLYQAASRQRSSQLLAQLRERFPDLEIVMREPSDGLFVIHVGGRAAP